MIATDSVAAAERPRTPRPVAWLVLVAAAVAVVAIGMTTTVAVLASVEPHLSPVPPAFWLAVLGGALCTCASLGLRTVRWIFLLRRAGIRVPLRDACIGYLAGFSLLFVPLLAGEVAVRAYVHRRRARVPAAAIVVVAIWERLLDVAALAFIASVAVGLLAAPEAAIVPLTFVAAMSTRSFRQMALRVIAGVAHLVTRPFSRDEPEVTASALAGMADHAAWAAAFLTSVAAWLLPGIALWAAAASWTGAFRVAHAQLAYASSAIAGGLMLAPGGIRVVGSSLIADLTANGLPEPNAAVTVLAVRMVTAGVATIVGGMFVWIHVRTRSPASDSHFDDIAHAYDAQIPEAQRDALLLRKTELMRGVLGRQGTGGRLGLDVGCGQGWYVARMRQLGFDVRGIDSSAGQIARARRQVDDPSVISEGSALQIAASDATFDFAYTINVLHHLASVDEQRAAFAELLRVLRPGGVLFVHEINTRNLLFRFYMGYVFPSLNCIDEGTERWLRPERLATYTGAPVVGVEYFTFMPEFVPASVLRRLRPIEARLEASSLRVFSAHYMAVLQKPADPQ